MTVKGKMVGEDKNLHLARILLGLKRRKERDYEVLEMSDTQREEAHKELNILFYGTEDPMT